MKPSPIPISLRQPLLIAGTLGLAALAALTPLSGKDARRLKLDDTPLALDARPAFTFGPVIKRVAPSVVNIYTAKTLCENPRVSPLFDDPLLQQFFGVPGPRSRPRTTQASARRRADRGCPARRRFR